MIRPSRWVLLDRDGTINVKAPDGEYVTAPEQLQLLPGAADAIARLNRMGMRVVVVTNQRGIARERMSPQDLEAIHARLTDLLAARGAHVDAVLTCPHDDGQCECRKPCTGLLEEAARLVGLPLREAVMIGDSDSDVEAGRHAGTATTIKLGNKGSARFDLLASSLAHAVDLLTEASSS